MFHSSALAALASSVALAAAADFVSVPVSKAPAPVLSMKNLTSQEANRRQSFGTSVLGNADGKANAPAVNIDVTYTAETYVSYFFGVRSSG